MAQMQKIARGVTLVGSLFGLGYLLLGGGLSLWEALTALVAVAAAALKPGTRVFDLVVLGLMVLVYGVAQSTPPTAEIAGFTGLLLIAGALQGKRPWASVLGLGGIVLGLFVIALNFWRVGDHQTLTILAQLSFGLACAGLAWFCRGVCVDEPEVELSVPASAVGPVDWVGKALVGLAFFLPLGEGMAWFGIASVGVALALYGREHGLIWTQFSMGRLGWPLALWAVAGVLAILFGGYGWLDPGELGRWGPLVALPLVLGAGRLTGSYWMGQAALAFCISLALSALVGVAQYTYGYALVEWLREWSGLDIVIKEQLLRPGFRDALIAGGFYTHRLKLAHVLLVGLGVLAVRQVFSKLERRRRLIELFVTGLFVAALALTLARGAMLALVIALALLGFVLSRRAKLTGLALTLLAIMALATQPEVRARLVSVSETSALGDRDIIWETALGVLDTSPSGVGLGNYSTLLVELYRDLPERERLPAEYAHSMVLSTWVETGPLGLLGWTWLWWGLAALFGRELWSWRGEEVAMWGREAAALGLFVLLAYWVLGLTHDVLYHKPIALTFFALQGACLATVEAARTRGTLNH